nr:type I polyketide synthase [Paenibacillus forsythiae]
MLKQKERSESRSPTVTAESLSPKLPVAPLNGREEGVAIIGMSGQFPKSGTLSEFWENIAQGRDCVSEIPAERWPLNKYYDPDPKAPGKTYCRWMGALDDVDKFDPLFFNISPIEAELMDPQQRLFLENSWKCIEDAGISPASMSGSRCGVFVGCGAGDYGRSMGSETMNAQGLMGGAPSILSARISYLLNLKGPCLAIDTACSSSLVAIAEACNSLILRTSDMALAGGVNVMSGPTMHVMTSKAGMLSKDGRCFTFDDRANGFVPGEGVGVLLLKRLSDAVRDQDPIYGVIRGWAINQDGKTNGITAPSAQSQTALEKEVYERFHIDPETITLIEAHGTGTKLGDPIEVEALTESFRSFTQKTNYCALGSVKSNIGHLLAASGVSGVIKTLLALKYRMLPPTVHFQSLNEHILLEQSPFYVNTELKPWHTEEGGPRRAGVSSFGFSGTNAHVVIEEYISDSSSNELPSVAGKPCSPHLFPLSAKNEEQLRVYAHDMQNFLKNNAGLNLADAAYTLQTGREAMDCRLAIIADSLQSLCDALCAFADGSPAEGTLTGQIRKRKEGRVVLAVDTELVRGWFRTGKLDQVADSWCKGMMTDWAELYEGRKPCRVHLPAYPFAKERHWLSETQSKAVQASEFRLDAGSLHPLIHTNVSDNSGLHYRTSFTGKEFFFTDHVVGGHRTMPGAAFLEMARESAVQAAGTSGERPGIVRIRNTVWLRPIVAAADVGVNVRVSLTSSDDGEIVYKVSSSSGEKRAEPTLHGQGTVALLSAAGQPDQWDIQSILADCTLYKLSSGDCYQAFEAMGIRYGPAHQGLTEVHVGEGQLLARLSLPDCVFGTFESYVLHPSMLDSALQSAIGFIWSSVDAKGSSGDDRPKPYLPFALDELEIYAACQPSMWASVRIRADEGSHSGKIQRLDIDLCDENGKVCVRIKGFSTRSSVGGNIEATEKGTGDSVDPAASMTGSTALVPVWDTAVPAMSISDERREGVVIFGGEAAEQAVLLQRYPHAKVLDMSLSGAIEDFEASVSRCGSVEHIVWIAPHHQPFAPVEEALLETQNGSVLQLFRLVKALLRLDYGSRNITWSVITKNAQAIRKQDRPNSAHAGIHGFIGSMAKEHPCWSVRLIDLEVNAAWPVEQMFRLPPDPQGDAWGYRQGEWFRQTLIPCQISSASPSAYRHGGVYVVIGGAGGIGEVWSEYMIRNYRARVVWLGRRPADDSIRTRIGRLAALGPAPEYVRADAADRGSLEQAYETVKKKFGAIHGVVHSAIVLLDQSLAHMEEERFQAGMAAKTDVSVRIAQVFERETLDFILFFSSFNSMLKSAGQSNYTAGCTFKDAFAAQLSRERSCKIKVINWGYWGSVGSVATRRYQERMARVGLGSIEPEEAMAVLESLLTGPVDQLALLKATMPNVMGSLVSGDSLRIYPSKAESVAERMMQRLAVGCDSSECSKQIADLDLACSDKQGAPGHILENLLHIAADILKVEQADIDTEAAWRECGFDPLTLACLADELSRTYNMDINAEMIQERMTLSSIAEFVSEKGKYVP